MAIQPALQVVTRVLNTNHPYWTALLDAKSRRRIDPSLLPHCKADKAKTSWISFTTDFDSSPKPMIDTAQLDRLGYDLPEAVGEFLHERLELDIFSSTKTWEKGTALDAITWGETGAHSEQSSVDATISISIGAEMMWPLLNPEFTYQEKASVNMMIAATMLHELAVSKVVTSLAPSSTG